MYKYLSLSLLVFFSVSLTSVSVPSCSSYFYRSNISLVTLSLRKPPSFYPFPLADTNQFSVHTSQNLNSPFSLFSSILIFIFSQPLCACFPPKILLPSISFSLSTTSLALSLSLSLSVCLSFVLSSFSRLLAKFLFFSLRSFSIESPLQTEGEIQVEGSKDALTANSVSLSSSDEA